MTASFRSKNIGNVVAWAVTGVAWMFTAAPISAQTATPAKVAPPAAADPRPTDPVVPPDYVIGNDDVLSIVFWKDRDMSAEMQVRPDGKISLPLINEVMAAGLTPDQLRETLLEASKKFIGDASVSVVVRQINSRRVYIIGQVNKPGLYPLTSQTSVLQLLAIAGGVSEYANAKRIVIMRTQNGKQVSLPFNYKDVISGKNLNQNIDLKPGDTVIVP